MRAAHGNATRDGRRATPRARADDRVRRAHAGHVPGGAGPDHRLHGAADDRRRPRRPQPPVLGRDGVPARIDGLDPDLRQARRHVRAQARLPGRDHHLPDRLDAGRPEPVDDAADRLPLPAGGRRRWADGECPGNHRRHRAAPAARPLHGADRLGLRRRLGRGAAAGRLLRRPDLVALGLLRQHADRHPGGADRDLQAAPAHTAHAPPHRLLRRGAADRGRRCADPAHELGRQPVRLELADDLRARHRRGHPARRSSSGRSAAPKSPSCRSRCSARAFSTSRAPWA